MKTTITFVYSVMFPEQQYPLLLNFEATFSPGGIGAYEFWGQKCHDSRLELDEIICTDAGNLSPAGLNYVNGLIEDGELDKAAWDALAAQPGEPEPPLND